MKKHMLISAVACGLLMVSMSVEARGGGHGGGFHGGGFHGGGFHGGARHWGGGARGHHGYHGYRGYTANNYYYGGGGGWGYYGGVWPGAYVWPGYYTGGPVGYYNAPGRCYQQKVCPRNRPCHFRRICR